MSRLTEMAEDLGKLLDEKRDAYGRSSERSGDILAILYPDGVPPASYGDMQLLTRIIDKMFRIARHPDGDPMNEDPYMDIGGYGLLGASRIETRETRKARS